MNPAILDHIVLRKSIPTLVHLNEPVYNLEACRFKIFYSSPKPLHLRFTFINDYEEQSTYQVLDIMNGIRFNLYAVSSDKNKMFTKLELYTDLDTIIQLRIEVLMEDIVSN